MPEFIKVLVLADRSIKYGLADKDGKYPQQVTEDFPFYVAEDGVGQIKTIAEDSEGKPVVFGVSLTLLVDKVIDRRTR